MRKQRSFQENSVQNLQIQQQFDKLMQIEGLSLSRDQPKDPFPSLKPLFHANTAVNIIGQGPNANIRAFYYLLLCHIRKQHFTKLVNEQKLRQANECEQYEEYRRDRRVSFNNKTTVFLNGPQYQNYALHKLKIYAFSSKTDLLSITSTPFQSQSVLKFKGQKLTSHQLKKLLSQFLKELLPTDLPQNYKETLKSVRFHLNRHRVAGLILTIVMRHVLFSNYDIQSAQNFQCQLNDHTVCTTLCDAFAINGLLCKENLFEINTWCKVYSVNFSKGKQLFVEMFNDEFEELGFSNDRKTGLIGCREVAPQMSIASSRKESEVIENSEERYNSGEYHLPSFKASFPSNSEKSDSELNKHNESSSMMEADEDSEMSYGQDWKKAKDCLKSALSDQFRSNEQNSSSINDGFRQTFNSNRKIIQASILKEMQSQQSEIKSQLTYKKQEIPTEKVQSQSQSPLIKVPSECKPQISQNPSLFNQNTQNSHLNYNTKEQLQQAEIRSSSKRLTLDTEQGCTSPNLMQKLHSQKAKGVKMVKVGSSQDEQRTNIVNNNINNNIYLTLGDNVNKPYIPVINITTTNNDPNCINIKLS